jgi:hypothetical protein
MTEKKKSKYWEENLSQHSFFLQLIPQVTTTWAMPQMTADSLRVKCGYVLSGQEHAGMRWC